MVYSMKFLKTSSLYFPLWLVMGVMIYAAYGYKQKRLEEQKRIEMQKKVEKLIAR